MKGVPAVVRGEKFSFRCESERNLSSDFIAECVLTGGEKSFSSFSRQASSNVNFYIHVIQRRHIIFKLVMVLSSIKIYR